MKKSIITLASISYGSYDGAAWPLEFTSKAAQQSLLNDIYEMMPYLQAFETSDAKKISFKLPREMMNELYDNYMRRPYKWQWSSDMQHKKEVKQSQEDKMWADRNIHLSNKAQEIDQAWREHDKIQENREDGLEESISRNNRRDKMKNRKKYTKKQITEAIAYWEKRLNEASEYYKEIGEQLAPYVIKVNHERGSDEEECQVFVNAIFALANLILSRSDAESWQKEVAQKVDDLITEYMI